jgi:hypothetical protein
VSKKKRPISESKVFMQACERILAMYSCCTGDTERCFVGGCSQQGDHCLVFFRGDVDDVFAVQEFLTKRKRK